MKKVLKGSFLTVTYTCSQGHVNTWYSQPLLNRMPAGNRLLSAGILFSGSTYAKLSQLANILAIMAERTFYSIQAKYLFPVVHETWVSHKKEIYSGVRGSNWVVMDDVAALVTVPSIALTPLCHKTQENY